MKNNIFKKLNIFIIIACTLLTNFNAYAEANVIYSTTAPIDYSTNNNESIALDETDIYTAYQYTEGTVDEITVYNIIENNNNYYCYENGHYATNGWRKISKRSYAQITYVDNYDNGYIWCYFTSNGKAVKASNNSVKKVKIGNCYYAFNEYGQMLTGFFNDQGEMWDEREDDDPFDLYNDGDLYHADEKTGVLTTGWYKLNTLSDKYPNKNSIWMYFNTSTFKAVRSTGDNYKKLTVDGKRYAFDDNGVMLTGFEASQYNEDHGGSSETVYFGEDGAEVTSGFYNIDLSDELNYEKYGDDYDDYEDLTIYLSKNGVIYKNQIKKIGSYQYGFDENGVIVRGLSVWNNNDYIDTIDTDSTDAKKFITDGTYRTKSGSTSSLNNSDVIHYFDSKGRKITSNTKLDFDDESYTYSAASSGAYEGLHNKKYYVHGLLIKPTNDTKYGVYIPNPSKERYSTSEICNMNNIVINKNGSVESSSSGVLKDEDENYWVISNSRLINIYNIQVKKSGGKYYFRGVSDSSETWIEFGEKDSYGRTCTIDVVANGTRLSNGAISYYQTSIPRDAAINFYLN